jgi:hypothetical protein
MTALVYGLRDLLAHPHALLADVAAGRDLPRRWRDLCVLMTLGAATYGAVLGSWHGPRLAVYCALKLPLVLLLTSALTMLLSFITARLQGLPLGFQQVAVLSFMGLAAGSALLASLAPVAWFFTLCAPPPTAEARTAHNLLYLLHATFVAASGLTGSVMLRKVLETIAASRPAAARVYWSWIVAYALVGGEVAWALRPFVGSVYHPVVFLRDDALDGNVYEFIVTDILPHLFSNPI